MMRAEKMKGKEDDYTNRNRILAVIRAFLTEEKASPAEIQGLTEKQWNHLFVLAAQHSLLSAVYDVVGKTPEFAELSDELRRQVKTQAMQSVLQQVSRTALFLPDEKELEHLGVQPLVIKGIVCRSLYPKPDLRPSGDEDLLISAKDFATVDACFMRKGFVRDKETAMPNGAKDGDAPEEMGYIHPKTGVFYEIHTRLFSTESSAYGYLNRAFSDVFCASIQSGSAGAEHLYLRRNASSFLSSLSQLQALSSRRCRDPSDL